MTQLQNRSDDLKIFRMIRGNIWFLTCFHALFFGLSNHCWSGSALDGTPSQRVSRSTPSPVGAGSAVIAPAVSAPTGVKTVVATVPTTVSYNSFTGSTATSVYGFSSYEHIYFPVNCWNLSVVYVGEVNNAPASVSVNVPGYVNGVEIPIPNPLEVACTLWDFSGNSFPIRFGGKRMLLLTTKMVAPSDETTASFNSGGWMEVKGWVNRLVSTTNTYPNGEVGVQPATQTALFSNRKLHPADPYNGYTLYNNTASSLNSIESRIDTPPSLVGNYPFTGQGFLPSAFVGYLQPRDNNSIAVLGDSINAGIGDESDMVYPDSGFGYVYRALYKSNPMLNLAIGGDQLNNWFATNAASITAWRWAALTNLGLNFKYIYVNWGFNDVRVGTNYSTLTNNAAVLYASLKRATGARIIAATITPQTKSKSGSFFGPGDMTQFTTNYVVATQFNDLIRTNYQALGLSGYFDAAAYCESSTNSGLWKYLTNALYTGTCTTQNTVSFQNVMWRTLIDSNAHWTVNQWVGYPVQVTNSSPAYSPNMYCLSNSVNTLYLSTIDGYPQPASSAVVQVGATYGIGIGSLTSDGGHWAPYMQRLMATNLAAANLFPSGIKDTPIVSVLPTASSISYGQSLADSSLSGGMASVPGSFGFSAPTTVPVAGTLPQSVQFTPIDTNNYTTTTVSVPVTVAKATPVVTTLPTASMLVYGQSLASSTLSGGVASTPGTFGFSAPTTVPVAGTLPQSVQFTPIDNNNYTSTTVSVPVTVLLATPVVTTNPVASTLVYGQSLGDATLSGGVASTPGTFGFSAPSTVPVVGTASQSVQFTPNDSNNYNTTTVSVPVTVTAATPVVTTSPVASTLIYGQSLGNATLSGGVASTPGTFGFSAPATVPVAGTLPQSVLFTPIDTNNYTSKTFSVPVTVLLATPVVTTNPVASALVYGQTLADATLDGGVASTTGTFAFAAPATVPLAGIGFEPVVFTPSDTNNFTLTTVSIAVTVAPAIPLVVTNPVATDLVYGQTLADATLDGGVASTPGTFAFAAPATVPLSGTTDQSVVFTPSDTNNFTLTTVSVPVTVAPATPLVVTSPVATPLVYGQSLVASVLSGGAASTPGTFVFAEPETVPEPETSIQPVVFIPIDTNNFTLTTVTVPVPVLPSPSSIQIVGSSIFEFNGQPLGPDSVQTSGSSGAVTFSYSGSSFGPSPTPPTEIGEYQVIATLDSDSNYLGAVSDPFNFVIDAPKDVPLGPTWFPAVLSLMIAAFGLRRFQRLN